MSGQPVDARRAAAILYRHRCELSPDILRTIKDAWVCASAARYGEPYETGWAEDPDAYREHDVAECEADDDDLNSAAGTSLETTTPAAIREQS